VFAVGDELAERFKLPETPLLDARYNIAPTQSVATVRAGEGGRFLSFLRWGLIPPWASDPKIAYKLLNARSETVAEKPSFRSAFKQRCCLIPASCFYEWQKTGARDEQPYCIRPRNDYTEALRSVCQTTKSPEEGWHMVFLKYTANRYAAVSQFLLHLIAALAVARYVQAPRQ
jgi:putative SOS response-associated peptidase YedK